jgi:hypothetical protein
MFQMFHRVRSGWAAVRSRRIRMQAASNPGAVRLTCRRFGGRSGGSVAGAVYGSPLADSMPSAIVYLGHQIPLLTCPPGENMEAVESLRRFVRLA